MNEPRLGFLRPGEAGKIPAILEAAAVSHENPKQLPQWFEWKFWGSPFGPAVVAYAETPDGRVAGVVAFGVYALTAGDRNVKAALSYETFVHPDHRGAGLFTKLSQMAMKECGSHGVQMLFNFPNAMSLDGFVKQGWTPVDCIRSFVKPTNWVRCLGKLDLRIRSLSFMPDRISGFDSGDYEGFDECLSGMTSIRAKEVWSAVRTPEYMLWRYRTYPMNRYVVVRQNAGWAVVRTGKRGKYTEAQIMELFPNSQYDRRFLRDLCRAIGLRLDPDIVTLTLSAAHPIYGSARRAGFWPAPNRSHFTYYPLSDEVRARERAWVLTSTEFHTY